MEGADMSLLGIDNWMVAWTPAYARPEGRYRPGSVEVGPWPDRTRWSDAYGMTCGCCTGRMLGGVSESAPIEVKVGRIFVVFHTLVVRDGIDPQAAHREFLKIAMYRRRISPDIKGSTQPNAFA
jgi:hypothetical protein